MHLTSCAPVTRRATRRTTTRSTMTHTQQKITHHASPHFPPNVWMHPFNSVHLTTFRRRSAAARRMIILGWTGIIWRGRYGESWFAASTADPFRNLGSSAFRCLDFRASRNSLNYLINILSTSLRPQLFFVTAVPSHVRHF